MNIRYFANRPSNIKENLVRCLTPVRQDSIFLFEDCKIAKLGSL
jgi:hypothetical protein